MAHLFKQMYVDEIDFDALTVEKLIDLVFTEMVYRKIQQLEEETLAKRDQTDGNQWTRFRECFKMLDNEERWISYAERAKRTKEINDFKKYCFVVFLHFIQSACKR